MAQTISERLAGYVADFDGKKLPDDVRHHAKMLVLDALGIALASTRFDFARITYNGFRALGSGESRVIGMKGRLGLRDAVMLNGTLVHGLDYDDTYLPGSVHLSASVVPTVLSVAEHTGANGEEVVTACALGLEFGARLGAAGNGGFLRNGFHATSVVGTFACTLAAGRLLRLTTQQLTLAQGIALSMASGNMQPMQDGSWTKRLHPGLAGAAGVTACFLAREGFIGPTAAYEGRFGLFPHFLGQHYGDAKLDAIEDDLGQRWEFTRASFKLFPACHQSHAFLNAAIKLAQQHRVRASEIESVHALVAEPAVPLVCEPFAAKKAPDSSYAAQFSLPYGLACALTRGRFGLKELEADSYTDPALRALAAKFTYELDPNPGFPKFRSGEVIVRLKDGQRLRQRENLKPDEPIGERHILEKFAMNATSVVTNAKAAKIKEEVLALERVKDARELIELLSAE
ncbi:MAG: MmgE/PrpD family protein [Rhodospirillaceae bacterium]